MGLRGAQTLTSVSQKLQNSLLYLLPLHATFVLQTMSSQNLEKFAQEMESARSTQRRKDRTAASTHKVTAKDILEEYSPESYPPAFSNRFKSFVSSYSTATGVVVPDPCSIFRLELLHNLHLGIIKMILRLVFVGLNFVFIMPLRIRH